jgi:hypothetical protein
MAREKQQERSAKANKKDEPVDKFSLPNAGRDAQGQKDPLARAPKALYASPTRNDRNTAGEAAKTLAAAVWAASPYFALASSYSVDVTSM